MKINIENLVEIITKEVIKELLKIGVELDFSKNPKSDNPVNKGNQKKQEIDMSGYKTPILTEFAAESIGLDVNEIILPKGTVFTPGARDVIKKRNFIISYN
ncbi:MAG: hypothetical protein WBV81_03585 [Ignavibacteriaceae bacterium]